MSRHPFRGLPSRPQYRSAGRPPEPYSQLGRALRLLDTLEREAREHRLDDLAERAGVSTRTLRRDLAALRDAGVRLQLTDGSVSIEGVCPSPGESLRCSGPSQFCRPRYQPGAAEVHDVQ